MEPVPEEMISVPPVPAWHACVAGRERFVIEELRAHRVECVIGVVCAGGSLEEVSSQEMSRTPS